MITLYIKTHNVTGLRYFGKTTNSNPHKYRGSGKYWKRHIKKYGYDVTTTIVGTYLTEKECNIAAIAFSVENNIVESQEWANLQNENGRDGAPSGHSGHAFTAEERLLMSDGLRQRWSDDAYRSKMREAQRQAWTPERKQKQTERLKTEWTPDRKRKHSESLRGRPNPATSKAQRGKAKPPGFGSLVSAALKGRPKARICRLTDHKEMSVNAFHRWCKTIP